MSTQHGPLYGRFSTPRRVQIVRLLERFPGDWWKVGQFGYAIAWDDRTGQLKYLVSKAPHGRGGAVYLTAEEIRFTSRKRRGR